MRSITTSLPVRSTPASVESSLVKRMPTHVFDLALHPHPEGTIAVMWYA